MIKVEKNRILIDFDFINGNHVKKEELKSELMKHYVFEKRTSSLYEFALGKYDETTIINLRNYIEKYVDPVNDTVCMYYFLKDHDGVYSFQYTIVGKNPDASEKTDPLGLY
jgi:hypothetical protein